MNSNLGPEILTVDQMLSADKLAIEFGISSIDLMEMAGKVVVREIRRRWTRRNILILAGPGNNGGDGFVVARLLSELNWPVKISLLVNKSDLKGDSKINANRWQGKIRKISSFVPNETDLVVDALFGSGLSRPLQGVAFEVVSKLNKMEIPIVSIDIPSGIDGNTGAILGAATRANLTVTFFRKKSGHLLLPGRFHCGETVVKDIGIPRIVLDKIEPEIFENTPNIWSKNLPNTDPFTHKYKRGHAVVVGGERMTGAARLASKAARRTGVGILTIAAIGRSTDIYRITEPGNLVSELSEENGLSEILGSKNKRAILVGPGNGISKSTRINVLSALKTGSPAVLDADALSVFEGNADELFESIQGPCILTPHQGEFDRIFYFEGNKLDRCKKAALCSNAVVVLKGYDTVIAEPKGRIAINANALPNLATAGSGDVLAGLALGLLAQGMPAFEAACASVWLHSASSRMVGKGLVAEDLLDNIPTAFSLIESEA